MRTKVDPTLRAEAELYRLRFTCEHCVNYDEVRLGCTHGYPTLPHRGLELDQLSSLEFCKEFELG